MVILLLSAALVPRCGNRESSSEHATFVPARVVEIERNVTTMGKVTPEVGSEVRIGPRISGRLARLYVSVGDPVRAGELIAKLDSLDLRLVVERAEAQASEARADEAFAEADLDRTRRLAEAGLVSHADLELKSREWKRSVSQREAATADVESARVQLGFAKVFSPISGVVASVSTQEGETVAASLAAPTFVTVVDTNRLKLVAFVDELDVASVAPGETVSFTVDALPDASFRGTVKSIDPQAVVREGVTTYVANVDLAPGFEGKLRPDMSADVSIATGRRVHYIVVPDAAIQRDGTSAYVNVRVRGEVKKRRVRLGDPIADGVRVRDGVASGEMVEVYQTGGGE